MPAARFTVLCEECVRIEWSEAGRFVDEPSLFAPRRPAPRRVVLVEAGAGGPPLDIRTMRMVLQFRPDGSPLGPANLSAQVFLPSAFGRRIALWHAGDRNTHNLGGTIETLDGIRGPAPIGEGLLARDGWHLIDDSSGHLLIEGWVAARSSRAVPSSNTDWYLFAYGHDYAGALRALGHVAGVVPVPRRCALGSWYSRYWPHTSAEFRALVTDYREHGIPLDVMVMDMDWHSGSMREQWTGWSWNRAHLPDAEELVRELHAEHLEVALNLHPADGVGQEEDRYDAFMRAQGADPRTGERLAFDAGNRPYMTALFNEVLVPLEADEGTRGIDFWWVDWQQDRFVPSAPGLTNLAWLNHLFYQHTAHSGRRGISLSRWAGLGAGDHRHPVHFSGDAHTGWEMLAFQVPFTVAAGNAGCFFWSHDIGGHFGPRIEECTARWVWFGALSAAMRLHSARTASLDRRTWTFDEPFASAMRAAFTLRSALMPYIDSAAHECEERMLPLLRPMYLGSPNSERAYRAHGQYMLGGDLLAAPVVSPGLGPKCIAHTPVWFPFVCANGEPAAAWFNYFTHERYEPETQACVAATIDEVPLFAPAGVPIPTRTFSHRPATEPIDELVIRLYPGVPGTTHTRELHEDDGATTAYHRGKFRRTPISAAWSGAGEDTLRLALTVVTGAGTFDGAIDTRAVTLALGGVLAVTNARINGSAAPVTRSSESGLFHIRVTGVRVHENLVIEVDLGTASLREARHRTAAERPVADALGLAMNWGIGAWPETPAPAGVGRADAVRICDPFNSIDSCTLRAELVERIGPGRAIVGRERLIGTFDLDLRNIRASSIPLPEEPLTEPPLGLRASRIARFHFLIEGTPHTLETLAETRIRPLLAFVAAGPFAWDWRKPIDEQVFDPELAPLLHERLSSWTPVQSGEKWPVDFRRTFPGVKGLAYAAAVIVSPVAQTTTLHLDSGDKIEAWLNSTKVFSQDGHDTAAAITSSVTLNLPAGQSVLLIKTNDGGGGWGFAATLDGEHEVN